MNKLSLLASSLLLAACATDSTDSMSSEPVAGELAVSSSSPSARVIRNEMVQVAIEIVRNEGVVGPVTIEVDGLPAGVTAASLEIAEGETRGFLQLVAADGIELGTTAKITIRALAGDVSSSMTMDVRLTDRPGQLDKTFGMGGIASPRYTPGHDEGLEHVALQPDGKIIVAGMDALGVPLVTRLHANGEVDKTFADAGTFPFPTQTNATILGVTVRPDGVILVAIVDQANTVVYALSSTGGFAGNYGNTTSAAVLNAASTGGDFAGSAMHAGADGSIVLSGARGSDLVVARLNPSGQLDEKFDTDGLAIVDLGGGADEVHSVMRRPDGRIILAGSADDAGAQYAIAQLTLDGKPDTSFSGDGVQRLDTAGVFLSAALLEDGRVAGMGVNSDGTTNVLYVEMDGSIDMAKKTMMSNVLPFYAIAVPGGAVALGTSSAFDSWSAVKVDARGALDTAFAADGVLLKSEAYGIHMLRGGVVADQDRMLVVGLANTGGSYTQKVVKIWL